MALPPPKVELESQAPAVLPSVPTPPVPVAPSRPEVEISRPALSVDTSASASMQAVQAPQTVTPAPTPRIQVQASRPEQHLQAATQQPVKVDETPQLAPIQATAPVQAPMAPVPMAPVPSPQVHIESSAPAAVDLSAPDMAVQTPAEVQLQAPPSPPVPAVSKPSTPAPASSSWAHQNDQFRPIAGTGGHGKAAQEQAGKGTPSGVPDFVQVQPHGNSDVMTRRYHRLDYKPTIFNQYWAPENQDLFTEWLQKLVDTLSFHKTFEIAPGVRLHCGGWLLGFGCGGDPPPPPSAKSNDRRLNMAPSRPLVPGLGTSTAEPVKSAPPQSSKQSIQCETARVAGSPMPPGCGPAPVKPYQSDQWKPAGPAPPTSTQP